MIAFQVEIHTIHVRFCSMCFKFCAFWSAKRCKIGSAVGKSRQKIV